MSGSDTPAPLPIDQLMIDIADYVIDGVIDSEAAFETAGYCLMDTLGCAIAALNSEECIRRLGPFVPGAVLEGGVRVPGTAYELDPVRAAFNLGCMVRWLDYNDTWLAAEWGHPSDNLCAILACADYMNRCVGRPVCMREVLTALIKAYEIQGVLALENSFNSRGLDHVILVRVVSCAVAAALLGGDKRKIINAVSNAWLDGASLRAYRHAPNTGWRKSWAAADAAARGVQHALLAVAGEPGYPTALSADRWGLYDVLFDGKSLIVCRPYQSYVMENILFKVAFPVEFHAQTAVECALDLHERVHERLDRLDRIELSTQAAAIRIIDKSGPLRNPAVRDHCLQYAVAVALIFGELTSAYYEDDMADDPRIDVLRRKMSVVEEPAFSRDYLDPDKRSIANRIVIHWSDGRMDRCERHYPLGHRRRRAEALPLLIEKFKTNLAGRFPSQWIEAMSETILDRERLEALSVDEFMGQWSLRDKEQVKRSCSGNETLS